MKKMKKDTVKYFLHIFLLAFLISGITGCGNRSEADRGDDEEYLDDWSLEDETDMEEDGLEDDTEDVKPVKGKTEGNTFNNVSFRVEEDGSLVIFDDDLGFVWYQDADDRSINYFGGPAEVYYGEEAYDYITQDYANNGIYRKKSVFNFSEEKMAEFFEASEEEPIYAKENMICMILHHEDILVEDEYQQELDNAGKVDVDTYYWGFYDGDTFLCYNIESGSRTTWIPVDEDTDDMQTDDHDGEMDSDADNDSLTGKDSHSIEVGERVVNIAIPEGAEVVLAEDYILTCRLGDIDVDYGDSYCELSDDAVEELWSSYDILSAGQEDNPLNIEPEKTSVGKYDAYYCRVVTTYSDDVGYIFYAFLIDIGEDNYLAVTVSGSLELTEEEAFELADVTLK